MLGTGAVVGARLPRFVPFSISAIENDATLTGPHTLRTPDRTIDAGNVVLWIREGIEYRLEGDRPTAELITIARAIRP